MPLTLRWPLNVIDDDGFDGAGTAFQLQAQAVHRAEGGARDVVVLGVSETKCGAPGSFCEGRISVLGWNPVYLLDDKVVHWNLRGYQF